jgi:toxin-antitoxin system PIN domain toxin
MIVPDVNLLVYAYNKCAPKHEESKLWWEALLNGNRNVAIPWVVSTGFVRIMTHTKVMSPPMTPLYAFEIIESWFLIPHVNPINPGSRHLSFLKQMLKFAGVGGNMMTDIHIASIAMEYQAELHSNDSDFSRFTGLKWINPIA